MNILTKVMIIFASFGIVQSQNISPNNKLMEIVGGMLKNSSAVQQIIQNMIQNETYFNEIMKSIPYKGKKPDHQSLKNLLQQFNNLNSLQNFINGGGDPMKMATAMLLKLNISLSCLGDLTQLVKPFMNTTFNPLVFTQSPLATMLDSWGKPGARIFIGNLQWVGAIDECESKEEFHYCTSQFLFLKSEKFRGRYGTCFPKSCKEQDVNQMLNFIQGYLRGIVAFPGVTTCNVQSPKFKTGAIVTIIVLSVIVLLSLLGTVTEYLQDAFTPSVEFIPSPFKHMNDIVLSNENAKEKNVYEKKDEEIVKINTSADVKVTRGNTLTNILMCFSIPKNVKSLLSTKSPKGAIDCINGIRFISMTWVILGHYYFIPVVTNNTDNVVSAMNMIRTFSFMPISNAYVSVDTFFLLSGLLVGYLTLKRIDAKGGMSIGQYLVYLLHRYLRLTPSLIILILLYVNIFPLILTGPFSLEVRKYPEYIQKACLDYWWTDILYINNFYPKDMGQQCVGWVWYLANDMQFYIVSPGILLLFYYFDKKFEATRLQYVGAFIVTGLLCTISFVIAASLIWVNDYPRLLTANFFPNNPRITRAGPAQNALYEKPYTRIPPYLVGLLLGYIFSRKISVKPQFVKLLNYMGWCSAIIVALAIIYGPWHVFKPDNPSFMTDAENIFYGTFHRFAWSVAVAWVIYACHNKMGGWVNSFLSWEFFVPLSRMTYGAYLLHFLVLDYYILVTEKPFHMQQNLTAFAFTGAVVLSYGCAFLVSIFVELPVANLEKMMF